MKWFKHSTACTSDPDHMESEILFKANGPYVFWRTLEILSREDAIEDPLVMDFNTFALWFPSVSKRKLIEILQYFDKKKRFSFHLEGKSISILCHKLSDISSDYARKVISDSGKYPPQIKIENKKEKENTKTVVVKTEEREPRTDFEKRMNEMPMDNERTRGDYVRMYRSSLGKTPLSKEEAIFKIDNDLNTNYGTISNLIAVAPDGVLQGGLGVLRGYQT